MASLSGSFTGPAVTASVAYAAGAAVVATIQGEWSRAIINVEVSPDNGVTWAPVWMDYGINGASYAPYDGTGAVPPRAPGSLTFHPPGAGLFRLACVEFRSGWCDWTISA